MSPRRVNSSRFSAMAWSISSKNSSSES
uniref:Uncharacterized protein n=1 Tax=Arundo donax TaxID=35708 RepID=A0A0A8XQB1_ARUDO